MAKKPRFDPFVFTTRAPWMQRTCDLVRSGHHLYLQGEIPLERAAYLAEKFERLYDVGLDRLQASRARKDGAASARLLFLSLPDKNNLAWLLLRTEGQLSPAAAEVREKWRDAYEDRIKYDRFEMVRLPRAGQIKPAYTWRYTRNAYDTIRDSIVYAISSKHDEQLKVLIGGIFHSPGFAGIRSQVIKLVDLIKSDWKRARKAGSPMPTIPEHLGYVRRIADKGKRVSMLIKENQKPADKEVELAPEKEQEIPVEENNSGDSSAS